MKYENAAIKVVSHSILVNAVVLFNCVFKKNCSFFFVEFGSEILLLKWNVIVSGLADGCRITGDE